MNKEKLNILWTNADPETAELMVLMYANTSARKGFWESVQVIVWGATARLVAEDSHMQALIREGQEYGVKFTACSACAERLGVKDTLLGLDIEVKSWGAPLTKIIKDGEHLITI